jgi:hypothetical protein
MTKKYLCFLDIDGVLTSDRVNLACASEYEIWHQFDPIAIQFFNWIHDTYDVKFVLMSSWKEHLDYKHMGIEHWVRAAFGNVGFRGDFAVVWKTNPEDQYHFHLSRGSQVAQYLSEYGKQYSDFILFDDNRHDFKEKLGKGRLVHTDSTNGLLFKHMKDAKSIMGTWEKK